MTKDSNASYMCWCMLGCDRDAFQNFSKKKHHLLNLNFPLEPFQLKSN